MARDQFALDDYRPLPTYEHRIACANPWCTTGEQVEVAGDFCRSCEVEQMRERERIRGRKAKGV